MRKHAGRRSNLLRLIITQRNTHRDSGRKMRRFDRTQSRSAFHKTQRVHCFIKQDGKRLDRIAPLCCFYSKSSFPRFSRPTIIVRFSMSLIKLDVCHRAYIYWKCVLLFCLPTYFLPTYSQNTKTRTHTHKHAHRRKVLVATIQIGSQRTNVDSEGVQSIAHRKHAHTCAQRAQSHEFLTLLAYDTCESTNKTNNHRSWLVRAESEQLCYQAWLLFSKIHLLDTNITVIYMYTYIYACQPD